MRTKNGLMYLLIAGEVAILVLILVLGLVKLMGGSKGPKDDIKPAQSNNVNVDRDIPEAPGDEGQEPLEDSSPEENAGTDDPVEPVEPEGTDGRETFAEDVEAALTGMTIEQKVAQIFVVSPETLTNNDPVTIAGSGTRTALQNYPVGGMMYATKNYMGNAQIRELLSKAQNMSQELNGNYLFAGMVVESEAGASFMVAKIGQEESLGVLLAAGAKVDDTTTADFMKFPLYQDMELLSAADDPLSCYQVKADGQDAVQALKSGADMLCVTDGFADMYQAVLTAVNSQEISQDLIDGAVGRILTEKKAISE